MSGRRYEADRSVTRGVYPHSGSGIDYMVSADQARLLRGEPKSTKKRILRENGINERTIEELIAQVARDCHMTEEEAVRFLKGEKIE